MTWLFLPALLFVFAALLALQAWLIGRQLAVIRHLENLLSLVAYHERGLSAAHIATLRGKDGGPPAPPFIEPPAPSIPRREPWEEDR